MVRNFVAESLRAVTLFFRLYDQKEHVQISENLQGMQKIADALQNQNSVHVTRYVACLDLGPHRLSAFALPFGV